MFSNITTRIFLFMSFALLVLNLQGCMAIPAVLAGGNMATKVSVAKFTVEGKKSARAAFREAAIKAGGVITNSSDDYSKSEFADVAVKVEIQTTSLGEYQIIGSSNTTVARAWEFKDNISETTQKIVDLMAANGFKVTSSSKN